MKKSWKVALLALLIGVKGVAVEVVEQNFDYQIVPESSKLKVAVVVDKKKFYNYLPKLMGAINSYLIFKNLNYQVKLFDISQLPQALSFSRYILYYPTSPAQVTQNLAQVGGVVEQTPEGYQVVEEGGVEENSTVSNLFYLFDDQHMVMIPTLNGQMVPNSSQIANAVFGGLDLKGQVALLSQLATGERVIVTTTGFLPSQLTSYEQQLGGVVEVYNFPQISYWQLRNRYIYANLGPMQMVQFLSNVTSKLLSLRGKAQPVGLILVPQLGYSNLLIQLTQPVDRKKVVVANSILNLPPQLLVTSNLLEGDISYNWLGYTSQVMLNRIYNQKNGLPESDLTDFGLEVVGNQVAYKTNLYQIVEGGFSQVALPTPAPSPASTSPYSGSQVAPSSPPSQLPSPSISSGGPTPSTSPIETQPEPITQAPQPSPTPSYPSQSPRSQPSQLPVKPLPTNPTPSATPNSSPAPSNRSDDQFPTPTQPIVQPLP